MSFCICRIILTTPMQRMNMRMCTAVVSSTCLPCSLATPSLIPLHGRTAPVHYERCMKYTFPKHSPHEKVNKLHLRRKTLLINQTSKPENGLMLDLFQPKKEILCRVFQNLFVKKQLNYIKHQKLSLDLILIQSRNYYSVQYFS